MWQTINTLLDRYVFESSALTPGTLKYVLLQSFTAILTVFVIALPVIVIFKVVLFICDSAR